MVTGIYLAAGEGTRFGTDKLLLDLDERPLFIHGLGACVASCLDDIVVVTRPDSGRIEREIERHFPRAGRIRVIAHAGARAGMMSSLKAGLASLPGDCDAAMVLLADMPRVTSRIIDELLDVFAAQGGIVVPELGGVARHPRILPRDVFPEFLALGDGEKGMGILEKHRDRTVAVEIGDETNYVDVDTPADLNRLVR